MVVLDTDTTMNQQSPAPTGSNMSGMGGCHVRQQQQRWCSITDLVLVTCLQDTKLKKIQLCNELTT